MNGIDELPWTLYAESAYKAFSASLYPTEPGLPTWDELTVAEQTAWEASVRQTANNLANQPNIVYDEQSWVGWQRPQDRVPEVPPAPPESEPAPEPPTEDVPEPPAA